MFPLSRLGIQSYCFRHFKPLPDLIAQLQSLGLSHVELCGVHADFTDEARFDHILAQFKAANLQISSIGVQTFRGNPNEESWFRFARAAGAKLISCTFDLKALPHIIPQAESLAEKYDLYLGIHNHGGYHWLGNLDMVTHVLANAGPRLGLCLDTAWALHSGEHPMKWIENLSPKLFGIHLKDFTFDPTGHWHDVVVGAGNLKLNQLLPLALSAPHLQTLTLEYEGDITNPLPALHECLAAIRAAASG